VSLALSGLRPAAKVGIVAAAYVIAFAIATLVVHVYVAATNSPDRQTYGVMFAFGDSLLFLGVLGVAAIPATGAALFFLRPRRGFWLVLSIASLIVACTAIMALALSVGSTSAGAGTRLQTWSAIASLRILVTPLLALFFLLSGLFAPTRSARLCLLGASAIEIIAFASVA
jgi:hypothetical protein